jgi:hypothetical protein
MTRNCVVHNLTEASDECIPFSVSEKAGFANSETSVTYAFSVGIKTRLIVCIYMFCIYITVLNMDTIAVSKIRALLARITAYKR